MERELTGFGPHAIGVYDPVNDRGIVIRPRGEDPLAAYGEEGVLAGKSAAWRKLDVAILQHLVFERIVGPNFMTPGGKMHWAFPHEAT